MNIISNIPSNAVILLIGVAGSGKTVLTKKAFRNKTLIVSSDECRKEISGNEKDQSVNVQAFELYYKKIEEGILQKKRVIADATNLERYSRKRIYEIAQKNNVPIYALMFNIPLNVIKKQNKIKGTNIPEYAIERMFDKMKKTYRQIRKEIPNENIIDIVIQSNIKQTENLERFS